MLFRIGVICLTLSKAITQSCGLEECEIKAALVINLLKFISDDRDLNFCVNPSSPLNQLLKIGFAKQASVLSRVKLSFIEKFDNSCDIVLLEKNQDTPRSAFIISDGVDVDSFNLKIFLVGNKFRFSVNLKRESNVRIDPRLVNLAYEVVR